MTEATPQAAPGSFQEPGARRIVMPSIRRRVVMGAAAGLIGALLALLLGRSVMGMAAPLLVAALALLAGVLATLWSP